MHCLDLPVRHASGLGRERAADEVDLAAVVGVRLGITLGLYLQQGLCSRVVELILEDIDILWRLYDTVGTALRTFFLVIDRIVAAAHQTHLFSLLSFLTE